MEGKTKQGWHLDPRISISHILSTVAMVASLIYYVQKIEIRTRLLEQRVEIEISRSEKADKALELMIKEFRAEGKEERRAISREMTNEFGKVNVKLDRLIGGDK